MDKYMDVSWNWKTVGRKFISFVIAAGGIYYVVSQLPLAQTRSILFNADLFFLFSSFAVLGVVYFIMGERWRQILSENGIEISHVKSFIQLVVSDFVNTFAPARAGDIYRGYLASNQDKDSLETSLMVLMERVMDVTAISILLIIVLAGFLPRQDILIYPVLMLLLVIGGLIGLNLIWRIEELPVTFLNRFYTRFRTAAVDNFGTERLTELFGITVLIWIIGVFRTFLVFETIDYRIGLGAIAIVTFAWAIIAALPLSPSGLGATDAGIFFILSQFGATPDIAGAFIILNRVVLLKADKS
jgi:uncharacterized membrane protein YbhN (UPF0104 family)